MPYTYLPSDYAICILFAICIFSLRNIFINVEQNLNAVIALHTIYLIIHDIFDYAFKQNLLFFICLLMQLILRSYIIFVLIIKFRIKYY